MVLVLFCISGIICIITDVAKKTWLINVWLLNTFFHNSLSFSSVHLYTENGWELYNEL